MIGEILEDAGDKFKCLLYKDETLCASEVGYLPKTVLDVNKFSVGSWFRCDFTVDVGIKTQLIPDEKLTESEIQAEREKINNTFSEVSVPLDIVEDTYVPECKEDCTCNKCERW